MNFSIKTADSAPEGEAISCDYTNKMCDVVIKLTSTHGEETGWMSKEILEKALRVVHSLGGTTMPEPVQLHNTFQAQMDTAGHASPAPQVSQPSLDAAQVHLGRSFEDALRSAIKVNLDEKGRINGSPVYEFIRTWRGRFRDPKKYAYPSVKKLLPQMDLERFEDLING